MQFLDIITSIQNNFQNENLKKKNITLVTSEKPERRRPLSMRKKMSRSLLNFIYDCIQSRGVLGIVLNVFENTTNDWVWDSYSSPGNSRGRITAIPACTHRVSLHEASPRLFLLVNFFFYYRVFEFFFYKIPHDCYGHRRIYPIFYRSAVTDYCRLWSNIRVRTRYECCKLFNTIARTAASHPVRSRRFRSVREKN